MCKVSILLRITVNYIAIISTKSCKCTTEITIVPYSQWELEQFKGRSRYDIGWNILVQDLKV